MATAYHWFNRKAFFKEVTRVGKQDAVVAAWGYNIFFSDDEKISNLIQHFYYDVVYDYWDPDRRHVENAYASVEFDFDPLPSKDFDLTLYWNKEHFIGYLNTWSAVQTFIKQNNVSPIALIKAELDKDWEDESEIKTFHFPLFMKIGRVTK